jgi:phosphoribosyl-AMP cyclohydrolase
MDFSKLAGLIPAVVQDEGTHEVLMVGFMNDTALARTRETGYVTFYSRTRQALWMKGETSGNRLAVVSLTADCDEDTVLVRVRCEGAGNVCHTGRRTCFFRPVTSTAAPSAPGSSARGLSAPEPSPTTPVIGESR